MMSTWYASFLILLLRLLAPVEGSTRISSTGDRRRTNADQDSGANSKEPLYTQEELDKIMAGTRMAEEKKDVDSNDDQMLYVVLVVACAGLLLAVLAGLACYYFSRPSKNLKRESRTGSSKQKRTKAKKDKSATSLPEQDLEMEVSDETEDGDEDEDQHSWLPISIVRFSPFHHTSRNQEACDASSIDHQSVGQDSTGSAGTMFFMLSYLRGIRRAAQQLGGIQFMFHASDNDSHSKKEEHTATTEEKSNSSRSSGSEEESGYNVSFLDMDILEDIDEEDLLEEDDDDETYDYEYDEECITRAAPSLDTPANQPYFTTLSI